MNKENVLRLKVFEAHEEYVGKNIVTLGTDIKQKLNLVSGDVIEINGKRKTVAQVWPEKVIKGQENIIKMDQYIRRNADVSIGDFVDIKKIEPVVANQIVLSPTKAIKSLLENYEIIIKKNFLGRPFVQGDIISINMFGTSELFVVSSLVPKVPALLSETTEIIILDKPKNKSTTQQIIGYEDIGGLKKEINKIRELVELPIKYPDFFKKLNIVPPKGILLYGPPGTGKTLLAKAISSELDAKFISLDATQIMAKYVGEAEEKIRKIFFEAQKNSPAIIFIDEIDAIASKRDGLTTEVEKRVVAQLLASMDGTSSRGEVIVIGATNRLYEIDPALRRPGRFDREIEIGVPNTIGRLDILKIHTRNVPLSKNVNLELIAEKTHGYIGADLSALVKEAGIFCIQKAVSKIESPLKDTKKILSNLKLKNSDFNYALTSVQPSALREVFVEIPDISLDEVGALNEQKETLKTIIQLSLKKKDIIKNTNFRLPKNILLYGAPGTGKTMFIKGCARSFGINFISIKGPEVLNKWLGESEKIIREIFKKARDVAPCILFFDEIDSIALDKQNSETNHKVLDQLLLEIDNIKTKDIIFVGATNRPDLLDKSLLRSGRIDKLIEFKIPNELERKEILKVLFKNVNCEKLNLNEIINLTNNYSGADLDLLIREAILLNLQENNYEKINLQQKHIEKILKKIKPTVSKEQVEFYNSLKSTSKIANYIS
jgi:transitional endoplasmic reticulum ATPase